MKLLITGICGFAGSELAIGLLAHAEDMEIVGVDNLSRRGSWRNLTRLRQLGIEVRHGDIRQASDFETLGKVDWVIDAAANASVLAGVDGKASSRQLMEHNLAGTLNMLEYCKRHAAGFVLLSTSRVYAIEPLRALRLEERDNAFQLPGEHLPPGLNPGGITEAFSTRAPISLYGAAKLASEQVALEYGAAFDFPVWVNRCSVMAGAGQFGRADQGIFNYWLHAWKEGKPLRYIGFGGRGLQVRDAFAPRDLVPLLIKQMNSDNRGRPNLVNLSGGIDNAMSLSQLSAWCAERWGDREVIADEQPRPFDLPWVVLDHALARETWGWQPQTGLREILTEIADFADTQDDWIGFSQ